MSALHWCTRPLVRFLPAVLAATLGCSADGEPPTAPPAASSLQAASTAGFAFREISAGDHHSCGLTIDGVAYCWGSNTFGALGTGTTITRAIPVRVRGGHTFRQISAGHAQTCAVTTADVAYCWGSNVSGSLGDGSYTEHWIPVPVAGGHAFQEVSAGLNYTCGVTTRHVAYCWGDNGFAQLGDGDTVERVRPTRVKGGLAFRQVSAGADHTCGVTTDNVAYCWGLNDNGELGRGNDDGPETCRTHPCTTRPGRVVGGLAFRRVWTGVGHTCGVTTGDVGYCWGLNHEGQLGVGTLAVEACGFGDPCSTVPAPVAGRLAFRVMSAGVFFSCGVTRDNAAYCWGSNQEGTLGIGSSIGPEGCTFDMHCSTSPVRVLGQRAYRTVSGAGEHACGATFGSGTYCWGFNLNGELGAGAMEGPESCDRGTMCSSRPVPVAAPRT